MTGSSLDSGVVWLVILVLGTGTFVLRLSFIQLYAWLDAFPPRLERALGFIPAAVPAALVFPALFPVGGSVVDTLVNPHAAAGGLAAVVAHRTGSMTATIAVGMGALWSVRFLFG